MLCLRQDRTKSISISGQRLGGWVGPQQLSRQEIPGEGGYLIHAKGTSEKEGSFGHLDLYQSWRVPAQRMFARRMAEAACQQTRFHRRFQL